MIAENKVRHILYQYDIRYSEEGSSYVSSVEVEIEDGKLWIILDIIIPPEKLEIKNFKETLEEARQYFSEIIGEPVNIRVRYLPVPITKYEITAPLTENN